jgi:hypothetical protein
MFSDRVPKRPKEGRRSEFASKMKKAARWPGRISAALASFRLAPGMTLVPAPASTM